MPARQKPKINTSERLYRTFAIRDGAINEESREVELSFSSATPYNRGWFDEILEHSEGAVDLARLADAAPLLLNHDTDKQIGVISSARIDSGDGVGRAVVRFGKSALADEIWRDVLDGIRQKVSVGYRIDKYREERDEGAEAVTVRVTRWTPFEVSIVAIPADSGVGVGRADESELNPDINPEVGTMTDKVKADGEKAAAENAVDVRAEPSAGASDATKAERARERVERRSGD